MFFFVLFVVAFDTVFGLKVHIDQILGVDSMEFSSKYGISSLFALLFSNMILIFLLIFIIEKGNKILDYSLTNFLIHFILTTINSKKIPFTFSWWVVNGLVLTAVTLIAEYICLQIERKEISLDKIHVAMPKI